MNAMQGILKMMMSYQIKLAKVLVKKTH